MMYAADIRPFSPVDPTVTFSVIASSGQQAITVPPNQGNQEVPSTIRLFNSSANIVFVELGTSSAVVAAVATSMPIPAGGTVTLLLPKGMTNLAMIAAVAGPSVVYATSGHGT